MWMWMWIVNITKSFPSLFSPVHSSSWFLIWSEKNNPHQSPFLFPLPVTSISTQIHCSCASYVKICFLGIQVYRTHQYATDVLKIHRPFVCGQPLDYNRICLHCCSLFFDTLFESQVRLNFYRRKSSRRQVTRGTLISKEIYRAI